MHSLLLVDDEAALLAAMREYFVLSGFTVDCATEMEEAQALLDYRKYSVLICDVALKSLLDAGGLEVISHLRSCSQHTRVVILTGAWHDDLRERVDELGVDKVLLKPQPLSRIAAVIHGLLEVTRQLNEQRNNYADAS